jgi:hypothetical protein
MRETKHVSLSTINHRFDVNMSTFDSQRDINVNSVPKREKSDATQRYPKQRIIKQSQSVNQIVGVG